jgi:hypothetical protein
MGNLFSGAFRSSTPLDPSDTLNYLTKGIFTNINIMDMFAMMDERKCAEYIIFGEKVLDKFFEKMRLTPTLDNNGFIYFKKMSTLSKDILKTEEHRKLCKEISHFFADVIRCFAAIYVTILWSTVEVNKIAGELPDLDKATGKGTIFKRESGLIQGIQSFFQKGGAQIKLSQYDKIDSKSRSTGAFLSGFLKGAGDYTASIDNENKNSANFYRASGLDTEILTVNTNDIQCKMNDMPAAAAAASSPTSFLASPAPAPPARIQLGNNEIKTLKQVLDETTAQPSYHIIYPNNEPIDMTYKFVSDKLNYEFSFKLVLNKADVSEESDSRTKCLFILSDFKWIKQPPNVVGNIENLNEKTFNTRLRDMGADKLTVYSGDRESNTAYSHMFTLCKRIASEFWINPNINTYMYLVKWKYVEESTGNGLIQMDNTGSRDLYFDESTRNDASVRIIYVKKNIKIPGRREPDIIQVACYLSINRITSQATSEKAYTVSIERMNATSQSGLNIEGLFAPLAEPINRQFKALTDSQQPTMTTTGYDIPKFIRTYADRQFRQTALESDLTSYRRAPGTDYYKIPTINPNNPYDLGVVQTMMRPDRTPFPACRALAAELYQSLGNNNYSTAVCNPNFRARLKGSLPTSEDIKSSKGIRALSALFLETTKESAGKLTLNKEWAEFEKQMKEMSPGSLKARCKANETLAMDPSLANQVQGVVEQLEERHESHMNQAFELLWELFDRDDALDRKGFRLNERLYSGGMEHLKDIKTRCVKLLTDYYLDCSRISLLGFNLVLNKQGNPIKDSVRPVQERLTQEEETDNTNNNDEGYEGNNESTEKKQLRKAMERI